MEELKNREGSKVSHQPTVVFDFDGVIHSYKSGWKGAGFIPDPIVPGITDAIDQLREHGYIVVVVSTRCSTQEGMEAVKTYLMENGIIVDDVLAEKPPAVCYIDDRAICFDGHPESLLHQVESFVPWHQMPYAVSVGQGTMKIRINTHGGPLPESHGEWIDLYTAEDAVMDRLEFKRISLGVSMELPTGYYAHVVPRSSTCEKWGIIMGNSMGVIENSYCGDGDIWGFPAFAIHPTFIPKGTRICQFRLVKCAEPVELEQVERLGNPDRGGWGSTGL